MKKLVFSILLMTSSLTFAFAGETATHNLTSTQVNTASVSGKVIDKNTNETLAGVAIVANGQKVYTDLDGNFTISNLCGKDCELVVSMISYEPQKININLDDSKTLAVVLKQR